MLIVCKESIPRLNQYIEGAVECFSVNLNCRWKKWVDSLLCNTSLFDVFELTIFEVQVLAHHLICVL